ncbi:MAG: hypothetical protein AMXMBFR64_05420 [Myxococcales bacterium]
MCRADAQAPSHRAPRRIALALAGAAAALSFAAIFFRLAAPTHPLVAAGFRLVVAATLLLPLTLRARAAGRLTATVLRLGAAAGLLYGVHFGAWVASLGLTSVAASVTIVTATPLLLATVALVSGRDRPERRLWGALGLGVVGVATIGASHAGGGDALAGDALAALGAAAMAGYLLVARRLGHALPVLAFAGVATAVGGVALLGAAAALGHSPLPPTAEAAGWLVLAALVPQLVGHTLLTWALRWTTPTAVGISTLGEPVSATLLGWAVLAEVPSPGVLAGCAVTLAGVVVAARASRTAPP